MDQVPWTTEAVFESYDIYEETFKTVGSHAIQTAILIPKGLAPGRHPVIYHVHGGFLITGHGMMATFFPKWVDGLALEKGAVIVSPDHRLLPTAGGIDDLLEDLYDGWTWTKETLPGVLEARAPGHQLDLDHVLLAGGSAGGYGVTQLALSYTDDFKAAAMVYPMLDPKDDVFSKPTGPDEPTSLRLDRALIPSRDDTLAWIEQRLREPHTKEDLSISPFCVSSCHHGLLTSHVFDSKDRRKREYYPLERIEDGGRLPSTVWVTHGDDDSTVPSRCSDRLQALVGDKLPGTKLRYDVVPGADHGFDFDLKRWEYFADEALGFIKKGWLS